ACRRGEWSRRATSSPSWSDRAVAEVAVGVEGDVARVTLTRPERRNAVTLHMIEELKASLDELASRPEVRVVVLAGEGPDFCAGADFAELESARSGGGAVDYGR